MGARSRNKGCRGEREWAAWLREHLNCPDARRGCQHQGRLEAPDVVGGPDGIHFECKRTERLDLNTALGQAVVDAGPDNVPVVVHRRNRGGWRLILRADDLLTFCRRVLAAADGQTGTASDAETVEVFDDDNAKCRPAARTAAAGPVGDRGIPGGAAAGGAVAVGTVNDPKRNEVGRVLRSIGGRSRGGLCKP